jgi:hypothetical protein
MKSLLEEALIDFEQDELNAKMLLEKLESEGQPQRKPKPLTQKDIEEAIEWIKGAEEHSLRMETAPEYRDKISRELW